MAPLVKVIVPCYGYADLLEGCVESVLQQEGVEVRVLVIDDRSPDHTEEVGRGLAGRDQRVEFRRHEQNAGLIGTANEGLAWADDSDYVVLLSADDLLVPGALQRATSVMESDPGIGFVYGHAQYFDPEKPLPRVARRWRGTTRWTGLEWMRLRCRSGYNCISSPEVVVRTSVQRQVGLYDPACHHTSDLNMWLRIAAVADVAYIRGAVQALYRIHLDSMLRSVTDPMVDLRERRQAFRLLFERMGGGIPEAAKLRAMAERALARQALWQASRAYDRAEVDGQDAVPVEALVSFALETYSGARELREWRGFRLRRWIGPGRSQWFVPFLLTGAGHRLLGHVNRVRWRLQGI